MNGNLIHCRILTHKGAEVARGPLRSDVIALAVKAGGAPWHILSTLRGWRIEDIEPEGRQTCLDDGA